MRVRGGGCGAGRRQLSPYPRPETECASYEVSDCKTDQEQRGKHEENAEDPSPAVDRVGIASSRHPDQSNDSRYRRSAVTKSSTVSAREQE